MTIQVRNLLKMHLQETVGLSDDEFSRISGHFERKTVRKNQLIIRKGDPVPFAIWIAAGCVKAVVCDSRGIEHVLQLAIKNWWLSDYKAFFHQIPSDVSIVAVDDSELMLLTLTAMQNMCRESRKMDYYFSIKCNYNQLCFQQRFLSLISCTPEEKYTYLRDKYPELVHRIPNRYLAIFLGVNQKTVYGFTPTDGILQTSLAS